MADTPEAPAAEVVKKPSMEIKPVAANDQAWLSYRVKPKVLVVATGLTREQSEAVYNHFDATHRREAVPGEAQGLNRYWEQQGYPNNHSLTGHFTSFDEAKAFARKVSEIAGLEGMQATLALQFEKAQQAATPPAAARG